MDKNQHVQTNAREAHRPALYSPSEVITMLKGLKTTTKKTKQKQQQQQQQQHENKEKGKNKKAP